MSGRGFLRSAADRLARHAPPSLVRLKRELEGRLPTRLAQSAAVIQAYVDDGDSRCFIGAHNFYSVLLPDVETEAVAELTFRDGRGRVVLRHRERVASHGALMLDVRATFARRGIVSPVGIVELQLTPRHPRDRAYRALGRATAHFFVHYQNDRGAVGETHPLSTAERENIPSGLFTSSQLVSTAGLVALDVIQYNALRSAHRLEHRLVDPSTGVRLTGRTLELGPLGAAISRFTIDEVATVPRFGLVIDDLPSHNAKPVLRRIYENGLYSVSHA